MSKLILKKIGWSLTICGLLGVLTTATGMLAIKSDETTDSSTLSENISGTLAPSVVGAFMILVGVIALLSSYFRGRSNQ